MVNTIRRAIQHRISFLVFILVTLTHFRMISFKRNTYEYTHNCTQVDYRSFDLWLRKWKWKLLSCVWLFETSWTVHEILQARIVEWVAFPVSRGSSQPRDQTQISRTAGGFFTTEPPVTSIACGSFSENCIFFFLSSTLIIDQCSSIWSF